MPDLYEVLQVHPSADAEVIRAAYRVLARRHHPDLGGDGSMMKAINEAWATLRDPILRWAYDAARSEMNRSTATRSRAAAFTETVYEPTSFDGAPVEAPVSGPIASRRTATDPIAARGMASGTVLDFGRYSGWSIGQLATHDPNYLEWLSRTPIGRPLRAEILGSLEIRPSQSSATATATATATGPRQRRRSFP
ncbi:MAG TPA: J domain-containing protein [Candidatus Acidoferrum sp.]|nr:J domain-containing protein [Candidatus Acidoferrum sp.]